MKPSKARKVVLGLDEKITLKEGTTMSQMMVPMNVPMLWTD